MKNTIESITAMSSRNTKRVPVSDLRAEWYTPLTLTDGQPKWGY